MKSKTEHLTGQTVKPFFPVLASKIQTEVRIVGSHLQVDASGQLRPDAAGGGCDALPAVHSDVGQHVLPLLLRGASLIGLKRHKGNRASLTCIHCSKNQSYAPWPALPFHNVHSFFTWSLPKSHLWAWRVGPVLLSQWEARIVDTKESIPSLTYWTAYTESLCLI